MIRGFVLKVIVKCLIEKKIMVNIKLDFSK